MQITCAYPWIVLGIPIFYLLYWKRPRRSPVPAYAALTLVDTLPQSPRQRLRPFILHLLMALLISAVFIGGARPQRVIAGASEKRRNIFLTIDVSQSMEAADIADNFSPLSRMEAVKKVLHDFIRTRGEDRIGIVIFGGRSFLQSPLTTDHTFLHTLIDTLQPGLAGDGTAIGDGLGLSLKRIRELPADSRAVILITDGANNAGNIDPRSAASIAQSLGIKIHTIGIGGEPQQGGIGGFFNLLTPQAAYDEALLVEIAQKTEGIYFNAGSVSKLREIYTTLDTLLQTEFEDTPKRVATEYYPYAAAIALSSLLLIVGLTRGPLARIGGGIL